MEKSLSVVVPVYNESENIGPFYQRTTEVMQKLNCCYEIIFVNDGSTDDSLLQLQELARIDSHVKVIDFTRNFGKEIALTAGMDYSTGDGVIPIDADLQDPPELIPELIARWEEGYDVVYATRAKRLGETWLKKYTAHAFYRMMKKLTSIDIPCDTGDFRLIDRAAVDALRKLPERHRFMKGLFCWIGFKQTGIYYEREPRLTGTTKWNYWKLWNLALEGITSFSQFPLKMATYTGFIIAVLSLIYALFIVLKTMVLGRDVPGYPSLITVILFLGGVQLFSIGILGEYIGRIHDEVKQRPLYLVRSKYGFEQEKK